MKRLRIEYVELTTIHRILPQNRPVASLNAYSPSQYGTAPLPPAPTEASKRTVDNRPSWMSTEDKNTKKTKADGYTIDRPGNGRICVISAFNPVGEQQMPIDVDNNLPGCEFLLGKDESTAMPMICHIDTCASLSTGNLRLHTMMAQRYPDSVAEFINFDGHEPFTPLVLAGALQEFNTEQHSDDRLTAIIRYWTPYFDQDGIRQKLSFGLGSNVAINSIIGLPQLRTWQASICLSNNTLIAPTIASQFSLVYDYSLVRVPTARDRNEDIIVSRPSQSDMIENDVSRLLESKCLIEYRPSESRATIVPSVLDNRKSPVIGFRANILVMTAPILNHSQAEAPAMPLSIDNNLPGCQFRFGKNAETEISFLCHIDTCAAMSTGSLRLHQWIMTKYPAIVAEYIQYNDQQPFEPIKLAVALKDLAGCEIMKNRLTAIVRYWTPYKDSDGKHQVVSFGLGESISVNSIIGLPQLLQWKASLCFDTNCLSSPFLKRQFPFIYESTKTGIPSDQKFEAEDFVRPGPITMQIMVTNLDKDSAGITDSSRYEAFNTINTIKNGGNKRTVTWKAPVQEPL